MDPRKQECRGSYLYGAGYMAVDDNTLGLVTGTKSPSNFCMGCGLKAECEDDHERIVRELLPEAAELFDRLMNDAVKRGIKPTLAAVLLGKQGKDPYMNVALDNFRRGHAERGQRLVK